MSSKFAGLKEMRDRRAQQELKGEDANLLDKDVSAVAAMTPRRVGRPPGKRSNPDYQQVTVLLHSRTYTEVRKQLLDEHKEVSTLLNDLLTAWLKR